MSATAHAACRRFRSPANIFCCHRLVLPGSHHRHRPCSLSLNGSGGAFAVDQPVLIHETHTLPAVAVAESAVSQLNLAISALHADPPSTSSGIIRLEVPIMEKGAALDWLLAQRHLPRCYFSGRGQKRERDLDFIGISGNGHVCHDKEEKCLVSVAGVGSAVSFRGFDPFSLEDWNYIRRFLSKDCPLVRAYGAIRFDANRKISTEWKEFGSFYFIVPQVEFDEFEDVSMLAATIAWDDSLLLTWDEAVDRLQATMKQLLVRFDKLEKPQRTAIVGCCHVPSKALWNDSVTKALQIINKRNSDLVKVVLARCSRYVTDTVIDPLALLASLQVEGQNAYQFCIQPPNSPAFVGNTPEQLFHRKFLSISSEALAGTRSRGVTEIEDFQIGQDLLYSPKDDTEFTIVRDSIRRKLETICNEVIVDPSKGLRKLPGLQHICTEFFGKIRKEGDEFDILASLHPSPAVCGMPLEEARQFITEHEKFDRGMYAGPIGWFGGSESEFAVGIRSALVGQDLNTLVYAGAGIVKGTIPSLEWEEVDLKISQFTKLLHHHELQACLTEIKNPGNVASDD